jgi:hypothetical protein
LRSVFRDCELSFDFEKSIEDGHLIYHTYSELERDDKIIVVDDFRTPVSYLDIGSDTHLDYLVEQLSQGLPTISFIELEDRAWDTRGRDSGALVRLALAADGDRPGKRSCDLIREAMLSSDDEVKRSAVEAASLSRWAVLGPDLERVARQDPDPEFRRYAALGRKLLDTDRMAG